MTRKQENENKRTEILKKIWALIESEGDEVIQIKKNEISDYFSKDYILKSDKNTILLYHVVSSISILT